LVPLLSSKYSIVLNHHAHGLHPVRLAPVFAQAVQHGASAAACCPGQRQCRQRVHGVVAAADAQGVGRHQALDVQLLDVVLASAPRFVGLQRAHQPGHAIDHFDAEVAGAMWHVAAKGHHGARTGRCPCARTGAGAWPSPAVVAVQHHQPLLAEDAALAAA
jgi:hypothetical protein